MTPSPLRYFWTVCRPPTSAFAAAGLLFAWAVSVAWYRPRDFEEIQGLALVGQALAASTGYRDRLIRGHLDPLLAGRRSRYDVALSHAALSIVPGLVFWVLIGLLERTTPVRHPVTLSLGAVTAVIYVSVVVWTVSIVLGRNTGGVLWMAILFFLAAAQQIHHLSAAYGTSSADFAVSLAAARAALVWPAMLLTNGGHVEPSVFALIAAATVAIFGSGVAAIVFLDAPLKDPS